MSGEILFSIVAIIGILLMWKYKKFVENRDQYALEQEVEQDFGEEYLINEDSGQEQVLEWLEDEQVVDTIIQMNSKK
jgi:membrane protein implicated in regulation of membrane protease activity